MYTFLKNKRIYIILICISLINSCAKRGVPEGGPEDVNPPKVIKTYPNNESVLFNEKYIEIFFDEFIKLDDINSQLVISPPIDVGNYTITPQGGSSKEIKIELNENLKDSITYIFNFGESIKDNNEGNVLKFYKYVMSTGEYIDSLELGGNVSNSYSIKNKKFITAMLYNFDEEFYDSIPLKEKPNYVSSTLDSIYFNFTNIKPGKYHLIALKDNNNNFLFDPLVDEIGFYDSPIKLPGEYNIELKIFKEKPSFYLYKPFQEYQNRVNFGYRGDTNELKINIVDNDDIETALTFEEDTDTLNFWFQKVDFDTIILNVENKKFSNLYKIPISKKKLKIDSLKIETENYNSIELGTKFIIKSNIPISKIDDKLIEVYNKDSTFIDFSTQIVGHNKIILDFEVLPNDKYTVNLFPKSIIDLYGNTIDSLSYTASTKKRSDYGSLIINPRSFNKLPLILELVSDNEEIIKSKYISNELGPYFFENIKPGDYYLRLIHDKNKNKVWDTGNYLKKIEPEETLKSNDKIKIRANWIIRENL